MSNIEVVTFNHSADLIQIAMPCISLNLAKQEVKMTKSSDGIHQSKPAGSPPKFEHSKGLVPKSQAKQPIKVESLSSDEFSVILERSNNLRFVVFLSDDYYKNLTLLRIEKKRLVEFSIGFLLQRLTADSIRCVFDVSLIRKHFPEFESEVKVYCERQLAFKA
ncbi:MAG: hypothetical protein CMK52_01295 [Proteobacteria bacterium]|nr:hypothetical protein [Pseudomonadota bacterium]|tara:strand:+ start:2620 stop:3108 length:489 start_codon:yes stop_codon:yes gene_type:complete